jgi:hypothetical protein
VSLWPAQYFSVARSRTRRSVMSIFVLLRSGDATPAQPCNLVKNRFGSKLSSVPFCSTLRSCTTDDSDRWICNHWQRFDRVLYAEDKNGVPICSILRPIATTHFLTLVRKAAQTYGNANGKLSRNSGNYDFSIPSAEVILSCRRTLVKQCARVAPCYKHSPGTSRSACRMKDSLLPQVQTGSPNRSTRSRDAPAFRVQSTFSALAT